MLENHTFHRLACVAQSGVIDHGISEDFEQPFNSERLGVGLQRSQVGGPGLLYGSGRGRQGLDGRGRWTLWEMGLAGNFKNDLLGRAVDSLGVRARVNLGGLDLHLAVLIRVGDWRPFRSAWWKGKEVTLIAADVDGNFIFRHSGGSVFHWNHETQQETTLAASVTEFVQALDWSVDPWLSRQQPKAPESPA